MVKKCLSVSILLLIVLFSTFLFDSKKEAKAALPTFPAKGIFPSVKLTDYIVSDVNQDQKNWLATHDDWIFSMPEPIDSWYNPPAGYTGEPYNQNLMGGKYFDLTILNLLQDTAGATHADQTKRWYRQAIADNLNWEDGFLHLKNKDTYYSKSIGDINNHPYDYGNWVDSKIRYVLSNTSSTNYDVEAWKGTATTLKLINNGDAVYLGRLDRFDEINLELTAGSNTNWTGKLQYWNGDWVDLPTTSNTTNNFRQNGQIKFNPPSKTAWKRRMVNNMPASTANDLNWGSQGVYFVRLLSQSTNGPTIKKIQGRHYWNHCHKNLVNGAWSDPICDNTLPTGPNVTLAGNIIPAWDPAASGVVDGDYNPNPPAGKGARFRYESRIPNFWAWVQFAINPKNAAVRENNANSGIEEMIELNNQVSTHKYYGAYMDNMFGSINMDSPFVKPTPEADGTTIIPRIHEYGDLYDINSSNIPLTSAWRTDTEPLIISTKNKYHANNLLLGGNTGVKGVAQFSQHFDFFLRETALYPDTGYYQKLDGTQGVCGSPGWMDILPPTGQSTPEWMLRGDQGKPMGWQWQLTMYDTLKKEMGEPNSSSDPLYPKIISMNNNTVTGLNTHWEETIGRDTNAAGSMLFDNGATYAEIEKVNSNTELILKSNPFKNADGTYRIPSSFTVLTARDKVAGLSSFMVLQKPATDYLQLWYGNNYHGRHSQYRNWLPAVQTDYGQPTGNTYGKPTRGTRNTIVWQSGVDPVKTDRNYVVYARDYDKAFIVFRPFTCAGSLMEKSEVTVTLPEPMRKVDYYGNISSTSVTSVDLRNTEGAMFIKESALNAINITKEANPTTAKFGDTITYTINYKNLSTSQSFSNAKIEDSIPSGTAYVLDSARVKPTGQTTPSIKTDSCSDSDGYCYATGKATWNFSSLSPGASGQISFQVRVL